MSKEKCEQMADYVLKALKRSGQKFEFKQGRRNSNIYFLINEDKCISLISTLVTEDKYLSILDYASKNRIQLVTLFYKDRKKFFRKAEYEINTRFKSDLNIKNFISSLGRYSEGDIKRMILFNPVESADLNNFGVRNINTLFYYQPGSEYLEEKIFKHTFAPVVSETSSPLIGKSENLMRFVGNIYMPIAAEKIGPAIIFDDKGFRTYTK